MICVVKEQDVRVFLNRQGEKVELESGESNVVWARSGEFGMNALIMERGPATISKSRLLALLGDKDLGRLLLLRTMADACYCLLEFETRDYGRDMGRAYWIFEREKVADITYRPPAPSADLRARIEELAAGIDEEYPIHTTSYFSQRLRRILEETK